MTVMVSMGAIIMSLSSGITAQNQDDSLDSGLNIPADAQLFENNPNVRKATAIVNGTIITGTDIDHRLGLASNGQISRIPAEQMPAIRAQILAQLIDETLQIQEAEANEIEITDAEVNSNVETLRQQNFRMSKADFAKHLKSMGTSEDSFRRQIKGQIAWSRVVRRNVTPFINVSEEEVTAIVQRAAAAKGTTEYKLSEIYLRANESNQEQVLGTARKLLDEIAKGANFGQIASQFSESTTAAQGGDLGWLRPNQLPTTLAQAAQKMDQGEIVVIPSPGGISILALVDTRTLGVTDPRDQILSLKQIALDFPKDISVPDFQLKAQDFNMRVQAIKGCGAADAMAAELNADVVNSDSIKMRDLPPQLQKIMTELQVGQSTPAFGSKDEGLRAFVLCGRDAAPSAAEESFDDVMERLENERIAKRERIYLRDLRRDAIIEYN
ncbi:hypothetical protein LPB140_08695 [Sphingorhabdus lutea]|uniref:Parvulin-like PPIase n=2 Tax=Sphingorhabdus lutea TaxID=1913578 RepID=A0A1L3JF19_9SPHN|nr:hypothetical protein LPB140_08695 [Sphingorhabdus lutea]